MEKLKKHWLMSETGREYLCEQMSEARDDASVSRRFSDGRVNETGLVFSRKLSPVTVSSHWPSVPCDYLIFLLANPTHSQTFFLSFLPAQIRRQHLHAHSITQYYTYYAVKIPADKETHPDRRTSGFGVAHEIPRGVPHRPPTVSRNYVGSERPRGAG